MAQKQSSVADEIKEWTPLDEHGIALVMKYQAQLKTIRGNLKSIPKFNFTSKLLEAYSA